MHEIDYLVVVVVIVFVVDDDVVGDFVVDVDL